MAALPNRQPNWEKVVTSRRNGPVALLITVINEVCPYCKKKFEKRELVVAISAPFHSIVHKRCWQYFDFEGGYPHDRPLTELPGW